MSDAPAAAPPPLKGVALGVIALALAVGTFMQVLDGSIANVSLPAISGNLGVSPDQGTWVITSFAVANGISVPLTGWLMGRYGIVKVFVGAVVMFTLASLLCGLAWNMPSLILFRTLQGAVSGPLIPGSQILLLSIFALNRRSVAMAIWSATTLVAPICGPLLGGWISDNASWRWIFLINVPVGIFSATVAYRGLMSRETPGRKLPVDKVGFMLLLIWVGALQMVLDTGKTADWFSSPLIVVGSLVAAIGFVAWVIWELTERYPIVDLSLLRIPSFGLGVLAFCVVYAVFFGANVLQPLWLQTRMGYTATWAGLVAAPGGLVALMTTIFVARFNKVDPRIYATISILAFSVSFFLRSGLTPDSGYQALLLSNLVLGVGLGAFFVSLTTVQFQAIPPERLAAASGISNFARITAGGFVASVLGTLWDRRAALHQSQTSDTQPLHAIPWERALDSLQAAGASYPQALSSLTQQVVTQAYDVATFDLFWLAGWICLLMAPLMWAMPRPPQN